MFKAPEIFHFRLYGSPNLNRLTNQRRRKMRPAGSSRETNASYSRRRSRPALKYAIRKVEFLPPRKKRGGKILKTKQNSDRHAASPLLGAPALVKPWPHERQSIRQVRGPSRVGRSSGMEGTASGGPLRFSTNRTRKVQSP